MNAGDTDRRQRLLSIFDAVVDLPPRAREVRLGELCGDDAALRSKVEAMLAADASKTEPFSGDAAHWAGALGADRGARPPTPEVPAGAQIGAWRITGLLGRGGMGAVYAVERADGAYVQQAALKRVHGGEVSAASRERFLRERQVLARLQHAHIATLLDGGFGVDGDPYFVMERVDGQPIDRWCDERRLDLRARALLFLQVLDAVQFAHRNLVVHRDLKPSNLLVTQAGQVKLLDFGIARQLEEAGAQATATSDRAMTLLYASPEQLHNAPITTATDLYQLGVVLYRLLSGRHPFGIETDTPLARQLQALSQDPEPLSRGASDAELATLRGETPASLSRRLGGSLEAIVHACLRRDPSRRYASAEALGIDLQAWLDDRPVAAARLGRGERTRLWLRRNRALAASTAAITLALVAGTTVAVWQAREAREQARVAERESANARASLQFLTDTLSAAAPEQAMATEVSVRELLDHARAKLEQRGTVDPAIRQPLQRMLGRLYFSLGDTQQALPLFAAGIAGVEPTRREEALALADDLELYTDALGSVEAFETSYELAEHASALRLRFAPDDPEQQLRAMAHLSWGHVQKHGLEWCRQRAERSLAFSRTLPDPPVDVVLDIYRDLSTAAEFQEDLPRMMALGREGLAFADAHGVRADSPQRAGVLMSLLPALIKQGAVREAEQVARSAIDAAMKTGGVGGSSIGIMQQQLADALNGQGRYHEAVELLQLAMKETERTNNGPRNVATSVARLARSEWYRGDTAKALALFERVDGILDDAGLPRDDMFWRALARVHAQVLLKAGRVDEAERRTRALREQARALDGEDSEQVALLTGDLVAVALRRSDPAVGLPLLAEARRRAVARGLPAEHMQFAFFLRYEAAFDRQRGDLAAAARHQREAVAMLDATENPVVAAAARAELATILAGAGERDEARRLVAQALPVLREAMLPRQADRADAEALATRL